MSLGKLLGPGCRVAASIVTFEGAATKKNVCLRNRDQDGDCPKPRALTSADLPARERVPLEKPWSCGNQTFAHQAPQSVPKRESAAYLVEEYICLSWMRICSFAEYADYLAVMILRQPSRKTALDDNSAEDSRLRVTQFTVLMFLVSSHAMAENDLHPEIHPAALNAAQAVSLPATPQPQRVVDKKFIAVMGVLGTAEALRYSTRTLVVEHEADAGAPWITSRPSHPNLIAKDAAIYAAELLVAYEIKKPHAWLPGDRTIRKFWWLYPAAMASLHFKNATNNIRTTPPGGCDPSQCQTY